MKYDDLTTALVNAQDRITDLDSVLKVAAELGMPAASLEDFANFSNEIDRVKDELGLSEDAAVDFVMTKWTPSAESIIAMKEFYAED